METTIDPIYNVKLVDVDDCVMNDWNPNVHNDSSMNKIRISLLSFGFTEPLIVSSKDETTGKYTILDGAHRFQTVRDNPDVKAYFGGKIPVVELNTSAIESMVVTGNQNLHGSHATLDMKQIIIDLTEKKGADWVKEKIGLTENEIVNFNSKSPVMDYVNNRFDSMSEAWIPYKAKLVTEKDYQNK